MGKIDSYGPDLIGLMDKYGQTGVAEPLHDYIALHSNLPGPRGNLELAAAFGKMVGEYAKNNPAKPWTLCIAMASIPADEAPVNNPHELIPFCGVIGIGVTGAVCPEFFDQAMAMLKIRANDSRWRMREAVPMALQKLLAKRGQDTLRELSTWANGSLLEMRAAAAAVAEPALLKDPALAEAALQLHCCIFERVLATRERKSEEFKALKKGLAYTLSVVVCAAASEGFALISHLLAVGDPDVQWIVKENLKKNRLIKKFPVEVEAIKARF